MSLSVSSVISSYTYTQSSQLRPKLDANNDGLWSKEEVSSYASDYETATGAAIDVDSLFSTYDADGDGSLACSEYEGVISDDALGMSLLSQLQAEETATEASETETEAEDSSSLSSWINSLSGQQKKLVLQACFAAESNTTLLDYMSGERNPATSFYSAISAYNNTLQQYALSASEQSESSLLSSLI